MGCRTQIRWMQGTEMLGVRKQINLSKKFFLANWVKICGETTTILDKFHPSTFPKLQLFRIVALLKRLGSRHQNLSRSASCEMQGRLLIFITQFWESGKMPLCRPLSSAKIFAWIPAEIQTSPFRCVLPWNHRRVRPLESQSVCSSLQHCFVQSVKKITLPKSINSK